ncbi:hypothetical protein PMKS-001970 [Pichia membranifaciens]|uniref:Uncharacterized protein n=1 Tax=Pichia membranifaciens TaxID=4926 RepID=A0A1Q2YG31_9ASCO|nr:hypothetical protein PMKS-001970 [Pichia membranifaciens]
MPSRKSQGNEYAYLYADTCYPFNIAGSAIGRSEGNLRLKTWREACDEKVRHEYNKALKDYNAFSANMTEAARNRIDKTLINPPVLFDEKVFPSAAKISRAAYGQLAYPFVSPIDNSEEKAEYEARLLLGLRSHEITRPKNDYPLKHSSSVQLPPISEILKFTPFDKSTVHPSGLSTLEISQYQNSKFPGIVFNSASKEFYNGREIKKNLPIPRVNPAGSAKRERDWRRKRKIFLAGRRQGGCWKCRRGASGAEERVEQQTAVFTEQTAGANKRGFEPECSNRLPPRSR